jgi:hypothetical protein
VEYFCVTNFYFFLHILLVNSSSATSDMLLLLKAILKLCVETFEFYKLVWGLSSNSICSLYVYEYCYTHDKECFEGSLTILNFYCHCNEIWLRGCVYRLRHQNCSNCLSLRDHKRLLNGFKVIESLHFLAPAGEVVYTPGVV